MMQPPIILLREGTDTSQGKAQIVSNINACSAVVDSIRTTLGPFGMDKLIVDGNRKVTISNDGATIMKLLDIVHPAASTLVSIAKSQDAEVGDGTTSVVLLAGELLKQSKTFVEESVHPQTIIRGFNLAHKMCMERLEEICVRFDKENDDKRDLLEKCASTALNSKLVAKNKEFFSKLCVDAVLHLEDDLDLGLIGIKKVQGGAVEDSIYVEGVAFKKTFSYAGFEQQPKSFENPKVVCLNLELELKAEKENAEVRVDDPEKYQAIVDAEWDLIYEKLEKIVNSGAQVILSRLAIGDLATQYFADRGIFCAGRVESGDLKRVCKATGAVLQTSINDLSEDIMGTCEVFEERQVGAERFNFFTGCSNARTVSFVLRGGSQQFMEESHRSLHDAIMIVRRAVKHSSVVAGGGAIEMELSRYLREQARAITNKQQLVITAFAKALEVIPRQLSENAGFDSTNILTELRYMHEEDPQGNIWYGVDVNEEGVTDTFKTYVWEPTLVKRNALTAAVEAATTILSIDETINNNKSEQAKASDYGMGRGGGRGGGMRR